MGHKLKKQQLQNTFMAKICFVTPKLMKSVLETKPKKENVFSQLYCLFIEFLFVVVLSVSSIRFKGVKKGGVTENASYYIFTQCPDGAFEAFPVHGWYNFTQLSKHRTLTAEEAEEEWGR